MFGMTSMALGACQLAFHFITFGYAVIIIFRHDGISFPLQTMYLRSDMIAIDNPKFEVR